MCTQQDADVGSELLGDIRSVSKLGKCIHGSSSKSIDFVLAFPQADLKIPVYMELTIGLIPQKENIANLMS